MGRLFCPRIAKSIWLATAMISILLSCETGWASEVLGQTTLGTNVYPQIGYERLGHTGMYYLNCPTGSAMDEANDAVYVVSSLGQIYQICLGAGDEDPVTSSILTLRPDERMLRGGAVDSTRGYGYFTANTDFGKIIKFDLGTPTTVPSRIGSVQLPSDFGGVYDVVIDRANNYGYFVTNSAPCRILKFDLGEGPELPVLVGSITLLSGEDSVDTIQFDPVRNHLYLAEYGMHRIIKLDAGTGDAAPSRLGYVSVGHDYFTNSFRDDANGFVYFIGSDGKAYTVTMDESDNPTCNYVEDLSDDFVRVVCYDRLNNQVFTLDASSSSVLRKFQLMPDGRSATLIGTDALLSDDETPVVAAFNSNTGRGFFLSYETYPETPNRMIKFAADSPADPPTRIGHMDLTPPESFTLSGAFDMEAGYGYMSTNESKVPGKVVKVRLNTGVDDLPVRIGSLTTRGDATSDIAIDTSRGIGWVGVSGEVWPPSFPSSLVKFDPGTGDAPPSPIASYDLPSVGPYMSTVLYEFSNNIAYVVRGGGIWKINLDTGAQVGEVFGTSSGSLDHCALDPVNNIGYFLGKPFHLELVKVDLGGPTETPTEIGKVTVTVPITEYTGYYSGHSIGLDLAEGYAILGLALANDFQLAKVELRGPNDAPILLETLNLGPAEFSVLSMHLDPITDEALLMTNQGLVKVETGGLSGSMSRAAVDYLDSSDLSPQTMGVDDSGYLYLLGGALPSLVVKMKPGSFQASGRAWFQRLDPVVPNMNPTEFRFYPHIADGNIRMALYDDLSYEQALVWESPSIPITSAGSEMVIPVSSGTPSSLTLNDGDYWLGFQIDSPLAVPSLTEITTVEKVADGAVFYMDYGPFPNWLKMDQAVHYTLFQWTASMVCDSPPLLTDLVCEDADGVNSPTVGYTNSTTIALLPAATGDPVATQLQISEESSFTPYVTEIYGSPVLYTLSSPTQGKHTIRARAANSVDVGNILQTSIVLDSIVPTAVISSTSVSNGGLAEEGSQAFQVTFTESNSMTTFFPTNPAHLSVSNATISNPIQNDKTWDFTVTPTGSGSVTLQVRAGAVIDAAGNASTASSVFSYSVNPAFWVVH